MTKQKFIDDPHTLDEIAGEIVINMLNKIEESSVLHTISLKVLREIVAEGYKAAQYMNRWIPVSEQEPPSGVEVLAKSPEGYIHLINWRPAYKIFTCQNKEESSDNWSWKTVE